MTLALIGLSTTPSTSFTADPEEKQDIKCSSESGAEITIKKPETPVTTKNSDKCPKCVELGNKVRKLQKRCSRYRIELQKLKKVYLKMMRFFYTVPVIRNCYSINSHTVVCTAVLFIIWYKSINIFIFNRSRSKVANQMTNVVMLASLPLRWKEVVLVMMRTLSGQLLLSQLQRNHPLAPTQKMTLQGHGTNWGSPFQILFYFVY